MIKSEWIVANMAARNALTVAQADVYQGAECMVLSTGSVFRAVRSGTGATMWAGVVTESGTWTPVYSGHTNIKTSPAIETYEATYSRTGDLVEADAYFGGQLDTTNNSRLIELTVPVARGAVFDGTYAVASAQIQIDGAFDAMWQVAYPTAGTEILVNFGTTEADATPFYGAVHFAYRVVEG
jgi:hypothetical protein